MTLEELKKLPLKYVYGMSGETEAIRVHATENGLIERIVRTPKRRGQWCDGVVTYAIKGQKKEYKTVQELLDVLNDLEASK